MAIFGGRNRPSLLKVAHQLARTSEGDFFVARNSFHFFRSVGSIDRRGRNGMNSVLRLPGYGSWGRARTGSWLRTNCRAPTIASFVGWSQSLISLGFESIYALKASGN